MTRNFQPFIFPGVSLSNIRSLPNETECNVPKKQKTCVTNKAENIAIANPWEDLRNKDDRKEEE